MTTVRDIYSHFDSLAPFSAAEDWDNSGLLVGDETRPVRRVLVCLDLTRPAADAALKASADLVITHHPVIFRPIRSVTPEQPWFPLLAHNTSILCMHTNLDVAPTGVNDALREALDLSPLPTPPDAPRFLGLGETCPTDAPAFARKTAERLRSMGLPAALRLVDAGRPFTRVAYCCGAGGEFAPEAAAADAGLLVTGEAKYHEQVDALNAGLSLLMMGHWLTEQFVLPRLEQQLLSLDSTLAVSVFRQDCASDVAL